MKVNRGAIWHWTGFCIKARHASIYTFEDLNPQVGFQHVLTRWDRLQVGLWFIFRAILSGGNEK